MEGLKEKKYLQSRRQRIAPFSLGIAALAFALVISATVGVGQSKSLWDLRSLLVVMGGTIASVVFQFDLTSIGRSLKHLLSSFLTTPDQEVRQQMKELDKAVMRGLSITELRQAESLNGELLNDVVYMVQQGLLFDEIDQFITGRIKDLYFDREVSVGIMQKAALAAPAFGLFGTVIGLVHVMQSMSNPAQIGPAMSLALMSTAYGAGFASLIFTPLAGRLEHHNAMYLEVHKQILSKIAVLIKREERSFDDVRSPSLSA